MLSDETDKEVVMLTEYRSRCLPRLSAALALAFLLGQPFVARAVPEPVTGKEIYQAVFQGRGRALSHLPTLRGLRLSTAVAGDELAAAETIFDDIVEWIEAADPSFFAWFEAEVRSRDLLRIEAAMAGAANLTRDVLFAQPLFATFARALSEREDSFRETAQAIGSEGPKSLAEVDAFLAQIGTEYLNAGSDFALSKAVALVLAVVLVAVVPPAAAVALALAVVWVVVWEPPPPKGAEGVGNTWIGDSLLKEQVAYEMSVAAW